MRLNINITMDKIDKNFDGEPPQEKVIDVYGMEGPPSVIAATLRGIADSLEPKPQPKNYMNPYGTSVLPAATWTGHTIGTTANSHGPEVHFDMFENEYTRKDTDD